MSAGGPAMSGLSRLVCPLRSGWTNHGLANLTVGPTIPLPGYTVEAIPYSLGHTPACGCVTTVTDLISGLANLSKSSNLLHFSILSFCTSLCIDLLRVRSSLHDLVHYPPMQLYSLYSSTCPASIQTRNYMAHIGPSLGWSGWSFLPILPV